MNSYHHLTEQHVKASLERLAVGKTPEHISTAYDFFKCYLNTDMFKQELREISSAYFGEDYICVMMKACTPDERYSQLAAALPGLVQRMEDSTAKADFQRVMGLMWLAIQEVQHLKACKVPHANVPLELKNLRYTFWKRLFKIEKEFIGIAELKEAQCAPGTINHVVDILTLVHDLVLVTDQVVTPEFSSKAPFSTQLIAEDFKRLKKCIKAGRLGEKGKILAGYLSSGYFLQAHYSDFFKTGALNPRDPTDPEQVKIARYAQPLLETCLGWMKEAQNWVLDTEFLALEDALQAMPIEQFVQAICPITVRLRRPDTPLTAENAITYAAALIVARAEQQLQRQPGPSDVIRWQLVRERARAIPGCAQIVLPVAQDPVVGLESLFATYPLVRQHSSLTTVLQSLSAPVIQFSAPPQEGAVVEASSISAGPVHKRIKRE